MLKMISLPSSVPASAGSNEANISRRRSIGIGAISQIFSILSEISKRKHLYRTRIDHERIGLNREIMVT